MDGVCAAFRILRDGTEHPLFDIDLLHSTCLLFLSFYRLYRNPRWMSYPALEISFDQFLEDVCRLVEMPQMIVIRLRKSLRVTPLTFEKKVGWNSKI
jgi:hypothetical protein